MTDISRGATIVTGGASGLGLATTRMLSRRTAFVVVADINDAGRDDVESLGDHVRFVHADVTDSDAVRSAVELAVEAAPLRVAVATAGIDGGHARVLGRRGPMTMESFEEVVNVNLLGTAALLIHAAEYMSKNEPLEAERGVIITTSSIAAYDGGSIAYAASKAGVAGLTLSAAQGLAAHGIRVLSIAPGIFRTPLTERGATAKLTEMISTIPFPNRLGEPEEFARFVESIVDTPMLNGEVVRLDAAMRLPRIGGSSDGSGQAPGSAIGSPR
jgi:NAD(P)-dependent dehydrogenase (short-subunit alcohol dehydrogenase family)